MRVFIAGGSGYIGSHIAIRLLELGNDVFIFDKSDLPEYLIGKVKYCICDVRDNFQLFLAFESFKPDVVIDMAAYISVPESIDQCLEYYNNNLNITISLLRMCHDYDVNRYIFSSSAAVYGSSDISSGKLINEQFTLNPTNPYAYSKLMCEQFIRDYAITNDEFNYTILRYFNVAGADPELRVGPNLDRSHHLISNIMKCIFDDDELVIYGNDYDTVDGTGVRDYIHVSDLAELHVNLLDFKQRNETFNCGYGFGFSVLDVINSVPDELQHKIIFHYGPRRSGDLPSVIADNSFLKQCQIWSPKYDSIETIVKHAYAWELKVRSK